jgi:hypothetical protein
VAGDYNHTVLRAYKRLRQIERPNSPASLRYLEMLVKQEDFHPAKKGKASGVDVRWRNIYITER